MPFDFHCTLVTPHRQVLDESALYASIPAWDGLVGIAPGRAALLVKLGDGPLRLDFSEGGSRWFFLGGGFAQMKGNHLSLLTDEAIAAEDIVRAEAEAALEKSKDTKATTLEQVADRQRQLNRVRVMLHLVETLDHKI